MARVMSLVTAVFIIVPIVAPAIGQAALGAFGWRSIFVIYLVMGVIASIWFGLRQEETLPAGRRIPFSLPGLGAAARAVLTNRIAVGYTSPRGSSLAPFSPTSPRRSRFSRRSTRSARGSRSISACSPWRSAAPRWPTPAS
jgi:DHA1 family bicyclomycin/chloramphenicol resistance-like MFS transporter